MNIIDLSTSNSRAGGLTAKESRKVPEKEKLTSYIHSPQFATLKKFHSHITHESADPYMTVATNGAHTDEQKRIAHPQDPLFSSSASTDSYTTRSWSGQDPIAVGSSHPATPMILTNRELLAGQLGNPYGKMVDSPFNNVRPHTKGHGPHSEQHTGPSHANRPQGRGPVAATHVRSSDDEFLFVLQPPSIKTVQHL